MWFNKWNDTSSMTSITSNSNEWVHIPETNTILTSFVKKRNWFVARVIMFRSDKININDFFAHCADRRPHSGRGGSEVCSD
jgi:hypothetical protein